METENNFSWVDEPVSLVTREDLPASIRFDMEFEEARYINGLKKQALTDLLSELPSPKTIVHIISNGSGGTYRHGSNPIAFEFGHFIPVLCDMLGGKNLTCYISTWTMNRWHALNLLELVDTGGIKSLNIITDPYFLKREAVVANTLVEGILKRKQRFKAFKNHVKAVAIKNEIGKTVSILASANLSSQPRAENYSLTTDPGLYRFLVDDFFEVMLNAE